MNDRIGPWQRWLLMAGLIPFPWFLIWISVAGFLSPGYSAIAQQASELTKQPGLPHLLCNVSGIGVGVGFCLFSIGLWGRKDFLFPGCGMVRLRTIYVVQRDLAHG